MVRKKTYGLKRTGVSSTASAIFGQTSRVSDQPQGTPMRPRSPLADVTSKFNSLNLKISEFDHESFGADEKHTSLSDGLKRLSPIASANDESPNNGSPLEELSEDPIDSCTLEDGEFKAALEPLVQAYLKDRQIYLQVQSWESIFPPNATVTKIAEATYAEVYRITTDEGTSIIKVELLQVPSDPPSIGHPQAQLVTNVVSEIRIMNTLTEVPGFVLFKDAHIVRGKPPKLIIDAFEAHSSVAKDGAEFPHPETYRTTSTFLVLELGDAGYALEEMNITDTNQVWDVFLGVTMALARAETLYEFEHRDLHESNICIWHNPRPKPPAAIADSQRSKYGHSDIRVTIIDYGLSRMKLPTNEVVSLDLEQDLSIFQGTDGHPQFEVYRRMRTHLFTGTHTTLPSGSHTATSPFTLQHRPSHRPPFPTWSSHIPYSNVLWIRYLLSWLTKRLAATKKGEFIGEVKELKRRLDPRTKKGALESAAEVLGFVVETGWVEEQQLEGE